MKLSAALAGTVLACSGIAGCGGSASSNGGGNAASYCSDLKKANQNFTALRAGDLSKLDSAFNTFHTLAKEAPAKISADWKTIDGAVSTMQQGFKDAGISFKDLGQLQQGKVPPGVDVTKLAGLSATLAKFNDPKFKTASDNIAKDAKDVCKFTIPR